MDLVAQERFADDGVLLGSCPVAVRLRLKQVLKLSFLFFGDTVLGQLDSWRSNLTGAASSKIEDPENAHLILARVVSEEVLNEVPESFDKVVALVERVDGDNEKQISDNKLLLELVKKQVRVKTIRALRVSTWAHVMSTLGVQQFLKQLRRCTVPRRKKRFGSLLL